MENNIRAPCILGSGVLERNFGVEYWSEVVSTFGVLTCRFSLFDIFLIVKLRRLRRASLEPSTLAHIKYGYRRTLKPKIRPLAVLGAPAWACADPETVVRGGPNLITFF